MAFYAYYNPLGSSGTGGGVTSLNTLTGTVTLAAGTNVTITPSGNILTIASSGGGGGTPGGTSGQIQYNNASAFGGFGSWNGTTMAITGAISSTTTMAVGTNLHVFGTAIMAGDMAVQGGANFSGNLGFYGATEIAQPTGNVLTALSSLGLVASPSLSSANIPNNAANTTGTASNITGTLLAASFPALTGDITTPGASLVTTLATVNTNTGSFGSSTSIPSFTVNGKGLITAASGNVVIAPAGTLSGTTLNATVVSSSLTSVGTIGTGVWNGTTIAVANGGTGLATLTANNVILGAGTSSPTFVAPGTSGNVLTSNGTTWSSAASGGGFANPMTTTGDMIYSSSGSTPARRAIGSTAQVLTVTGGLPTWANIPAAAGGAFLASSQITTTSTAITATSYTTFSNSPAFSVTPTVTGTYKVYSSIPILNNVSNNNGNTRINNTSGAATLLYQQIGIGVVAGGLAVSIYTESVYTLTAGTTYVFDIQGVVLTGGNIQAGGAIAPFYMFCEGVVTGSGALSMGAVLGSSTPNAATISGSLLQLGPADGTNPGLVTTGAQTFAGSKTFGATTSDLTQIGAAGSLVVHRIFGGLQHSARVITANYSVDGTTADYYLFCNQTAPITITLPNPNITGRTLFFKDITGAAQTNPITIAQFATETIEGLAASYIHQTNYGTLMLVSDGSNWWSV